MTTGIPPVGGFIGLPVVGNGAYAGAAFDPVNRMMYITPGSVGTQWTRVNTDTFTVDASITVTAAAQLGAAYLNGYVYSFPAFGGGTLIRRVPVNNFSAAAVQTLDLSTVPGIPAGLTGPAAGVAAGGYIYMPWGGGGNLVILRIDPNNFTPAGTSFINITTLVPILTVGWNLLAEGRYVYVYARSGAGNGQLSRFDPNNFIPSSFAPFGPNFNVTPTLGGNGGAFIVGRQYTWFAAANNGQTVPFDKRGGTQVSFGFAMNNMPANQLYGPAPVHFDGRRYGYFITGQANTVNSVYVFDEANPGKEQYFSLGVFDPANNICTGNLDVDNNGFLYLPPNNSPTGNLIRFKQVFGRYLAGSAGPN